MNKITVSNIINASKQKVWDYYTNPAHIINWNYADISWCCPRALNEVKVGGMLNARMEARDGSAGFDFIATYTSVDEGNGFTYEFGDRTAGVLLEEVEGGTKISVTFDPETINSEERQRQGWQAILDNFKKYTESN